MKSSVFSKIVPLAVLCVVGCQPKSEEVAVAEKPSVEKNLTMHITFDGGTAEAAYAAGAAVPLRAEGLTFGPGRTGEAVRLSEKTKSLLAYAAKGNLDWKRGTMSFWLKREEGSNGKWKSILELEQGKEPGLGRFYFAFDRYDRMRASRDALDGKIGDPSFGPLARGTGVWEHWVITWGLRSGGIRAYCGSDGTREYFPYVSDEEANRIMPRHVAGAAKFKEGVLPPEFFLLGSTEMKGYKPIEGWLDDVKIYDRQFSSAEVKSLFEADRRAIIASAPHFALEDEANDLVVDLEERTETLDGARLILVNQKGKELASVSCEKGVKSVTLKAPALKMGKYEYRLLKGEDVLARDDYTILRAKNPYELPSTAKPGEPRNLKFVKSIKPDLAKMTTNEFHAVGKCRMGELNGVKYLEGGGKQWDRFAIRFSLPTDKPLYLVDIIYPDDRFRTMDYLIQASGGDGTHKTGVSGSNGDYSFAQGISTGGEYPNSKKMRHHRCLYWTGKSSDLTFIAMSWQPYAPAAVAELRIYEVTDAALPVTKVETSGVGDPMGRQFGQFWEDPAVTMALRHNMSTPQSFSEQIDRYAAIMRYCGQNILTYPGGWYKGLIVPGNDPRPGTHTPHYLEGYYAKFEKEGMYVMPNIEFIFMPNPPDIEPTAEMITNGALHASVYPIQNTGLPVQQFNHSLPAVVNFFHPQTQAEIEKMVRALVNEGKRYKSFKGISFQLYRDGAAWWGDIKNGYNDYIIEAFEKDTGLKIPCDRKDPLRGKAYYEWIRANAYDRWVTWRCEKFTEFYAKMAKILTEARPDLRLWFIAGPFFDAVSELKDNPDYYSEDFVSRTLRENGYDGEMLAKAIPNAILGVTVHPQRHRKRYYWAMTKQKMDRYIGLPAGEGYYREIQKGAFPHITCRDEFMETDIGRRKNVAQLSGDWLKEIGWRCSTINAAGENGMRYFAVPLRFGDVLGFTRGSFLICDYGYEPMEARFAQAFRALPPEKMKDLPCKTSAPEFVKVRTLEKDGKYWFYAVNTEVDTAQVSFQSPVALRDTVSGKKYKAGTISLKLAPYELRSFVSLKP